LLRFALSPAAVFKRRSRYFRSGPQNLMAE
jgi:hypothetical protein